MTIYCHSDDIAHSQTLVSHYSCDAIKRTYHNSLELRYDHKIT